MLSTIRQRVESYLIDLPQATQDLIDHWINRAVRVAEDDHNFRHMNAELDFTTAEARNLGSKPDDWKERRAYPWLHRGDGGSEEILWAASKSQMIRDYAEDDPNDIGEPRHILELETAFEVYPLPDTNSLWDDGHYRVKLPYWAYTSDLVQDSDANWFTRNADDYLTFYAVGEGMIFNREEERASIYVQKATAEYRRIVRVEKRGRMPRTISVRRDVHG